MNMFDETACAGSYRMALFWTIFFGMCWQLSDADGIFYVFSMFSDVEFDAL